MGIELNGFAARKCWGPKQTPHKQTKSIMTGSGGSEPAKQHSSIIGLLINLFLTNKAC